MYLEKDKRAYQRIEESKINKNVKAIRKQIDEEDRIIRKIFSKRLNDLMDEYQVSRDLLSEKTGISTGSITYYVDGRRIPEGDSISRIANYLGVPTDYLLGNVDVLELENDDLNKKFGFNDETIKNLSSIENKGISNLIFDNKLDAVSYLYKELNNYKNTVKALNELEDAYKNVDKKENDKEYNEKYFKARADVEQAKFLSYQALLYLVDNNLE